MDGMATVDQGVPALPDVDYVLGIGGGRRHAVSYMAARDGCDLAAVLHAAGYGRTALAPPVCADGPGAVVIGTTLGAFESTEGPHGPARPTVCSGCAWTVAARRGRLGEELDALRPLGADRTVLRETLGDPDLLVALSRAALLDDENVSYVRQECTPSSMDPDETVDWALLTRPRWEIRGPARPATPSPETLQRLAHLREHSVGVSYPLACLEDSCEHPPPEQTPAFVNGHHGCTAEAFVHCSACSLAAGRWAGEQEGWLLLDVPGPCSVLIAAGAQLGVAVPSRRRTGSLPVTGTQLCLEGD